MGEFIGTFILVFFGCGSVGVSVLFGSHAGLFQVAMIWGLGVTIAIFATRHLSCAHLNPAVTLAMALTKRMKLSATPLYFAAQFLGAFAAAAFIYVLFGSTIAQFEAINHIVRGTPESIRTAQMFGEFYPNPGIMDKFTFSAVNAFLVEAAGTFILVFAIFSLTEGCNCGKPDNNFAPFFIGMTVTILISVTAPFTQTGLNPARDLSPRLFSYLMGWKTAAMPDSGYGWLTVYVLGPCVGAILASLFFSLVVEPMMVARKREEEIIKVEKMPVNDFKIEV